MVKGAEKLYLKMSYRVQPMLYLFYALLRAQNIINLCKIFGSAANTH